MDVGKFKEYIRRYEPDELLYKEMYEKDRRESGSFVNSSRARTDRI